MAVNVLSLSDVLLEFVYSPHVCTRFPEVDLIIGCGDLPYYYLEYAINALNVPLYYVRGNHANLTEYTVAGPRKEPLGGVDLHREVYYDMGLLMAGVEGSLRYRAGPYQYTQAEMWGHVLRLVPALLMNRILHGRSLDIFVTHAPPWGIHDQPDLPHQGIKAFLWLIKVFQPAYHFHGHIHVYHPDTVVSTEYGKTKIINTYGFAETKVETRQREAHMAGIIKQLRKAGRGRVSRAIRGKAREDNRST